VTVHFIGAGPGAPDLLTLRAQRLIASSPVCLYAGALVPPEILAHAPPDARVVDTQHLDLDAIVAELERAHAGGHDVARLHSGDLSIFSAAAEQMRRLDELEIPWDVTPGVPAFAAAAAALKRELTIPGVAQTVILTRYGRRASKMPDGERLAGTGRRSSSTSARRRSTRSSRRSRRTTATTARPPSSRAHRGPTRSCSAARSRRSPIR
jgi:precorrin-4/cobalt-precorrin-4 C11-methyltransferase